MSANRPAALADDTTRTRAGRAEGWPWVETTLTVFLLAAAVFLISFMSIVGNL